MPNRHGDLNIEEAAEYLEISPSLLKSLHAAGIGPLFVHGARELKKAGPWFFKSDLDRYRAQLPSALERLGVLISPAGAPKSAARVGSGPA